MYCASAERQLNSASSPWFVNCLKLLREGLADKIGQRLAVRELAFRNGPGPCSAHSIGRFLRLTGVLQLRLLNGSIS